MTEFEHVSESAKDLANEIDCGGDLKILHKVIAKTLRACADVIEELEARYPKIGSSEALTNLNKAAEDNGEPL